MSFVTNANFAIPLKEEPPCTERETFCVTDIEPTERASVMSKIAKEHNVSSPPAGLSHTFLVRDPLSVGDHERHSIGIVADFLKKQGDETIPAGPFHRTVQSEIRRRNDKEYAAIAFSGLAKHKGLSRADFQRMLDSVPTQRRMDELLSLIRNQLIKETFALRQQGPLNEEVRNYLAKRLDETNTVLAEARKRAAAEVSALPDALFTAGTPVADIIAKVSAIQATEFAAVRERYSDVFLQAMIAVAIYEQHEFPPPGPQLTDENA
jgi:hypothetical protein